MFNNHCAQETARRRVKGSRKSLTLLPTYARLVCLALISAGGCASTVHHSANLPLEYRVPPVTHGQSLDLSRLSTPKEPSSEIGAGDVLELTLVSGYEQKDQEPILGRVSDAGMLHIPQVGPVPVVGLEPAEAEQTIARYAIERDVYRRPYVTVVIKEKHRNHVTVLGAVDTPGVVELDRASSDVLGALAVAGGLTESAGSEIQIMRKSPQGGSHVAERLPDGPPVELAGYTKQQPTRVVQRIDLADAATGAAGDYRLSDGDVVVVNEREPRYIYVMGLVNDPKEIEIPFGQDLHLLQALTAAGGRKFALADKVHIIRRLPHLGEPIVIEASVRQAKNHGPANLVLGAGDIVSVEETPLTLVAGALQQFMRFGVSGSVPLF